MPGQGSQSSAATKSTSPATRGRSVPPSGARNTNINDRLTGKLRGGENSIYKQVQDLVHEVPDYSEEGSDARRLPGKSFEGIHAFRSPNLERAEGQSAISFGPDDGPRRV